MIKISKVGNKFIKVSSYSDDTMIHSATLSVNQISDIRIDIGNKNLVITMLNKAEPICYYNADWESLKDAYERLIMMLKEY